MLPADLDERLECCQARPPCCAESHGSHIPPGSAEHAEISRGLLSPKGIAEPLLLGALRSLESGGHCETPASERSLGKHRRVTEKLFACVVIGAPTPFDQSVPAPRPRRFITHRHGVHLVVVSRRRFALSAGVCHFVVKSKRHIPLALIESAAAIELGRLHSRM